MNTAFDSISIKIASPDQIKDESKKTSCKRRNPAQGADEPFICPEKGTCSCGEVKKAETINYRSFRPEPEGLFCEAIFGPQKDWECNCGKYKRIKHKGMICDRCGVEVTQQRVRRDRLGYIQLAAPVSHIWYFKGIPSRIGTFCELSSRDVERVLYFEGFIVVEVTDPECPLERGQVLTEIEYIEHSNKYWGGFRAGTGAEVIRELLSDIDLEAEIEKLTKDLNETTSHQKKLKIAKQLKQMADFAEIGQRPEWMILDVIPVIPPDLRPLVPLEGGRFATSDLNDLYRRVINRNNRLRKLIQLRSPEVILRNEKRMLQEAVDAFFDNGRHGRRVTGPGNRPLKSLADVLKGKIGRFRQNLLGKRVDYSGRSVIVVGPELGLHQCGIPKRMAVELFKPFIIERLQAYGYTQTIKRAKHIAEHVDSDSPVWEVVEEVIADHPVLLNRPPTLHRLGIQAFLPVLVEGKSIRIPPLVCKAFNADFDGDQMAVHVPLTVEAQAEAKLLMLSSHNILKPSHGDPVAVPELDMVLGPSFLTKVLPGHAADAAFLHDAYTTRDPAAFEALREKPWSHRRYTHSEEVLTAHAAGQLKLHDSIQLFFPANGDDRKTAEPILTTVGRVIFNEVLPSGLEWEDENSEQQLPFFNAEAGGRELSDLIHRCFNELGTRVTTEVLEKVQKLAFEYATLSGISPGIMDYITPGNRDSLVSKAQADIDELLSNVTATEREEHENEQIRIWLDALKEVEDEMFDDLPRLETSLVERADPRKIHPKVDSTGAEVDETTVEGFSPVHIMADSGARARKNPFMQISAVIGLKAKQSGEILIPPITTSYRDGLDVLDYFNSTYGSRKGLVDTAMKTAASGYLTRKLVDVAQDVRVTAEDCGTLNSIQKFATEGGDLAFKINGRTAAEDILHPENGEVLVPAGEVISAENADKIETLGITVVRVRSVLTCETEDGVCAKCYGNDLTTNDLVNVGEAVGIIAAQSIGEPGTQLTMRTFHTGGAVEDVSEARQRRILSKASGTVYFRDFQPGRTVEKEGELWIATENRTSLDEPAYKVLRVNNPNCPLKANELLSEKQYTESMERYKGFDTKTWQYHVTEVLDSNCDLKAGDRLSHAEYLRAQMDYGFQRFVTPKYRVTRVQHPKLSLSVGTQLTEAEIEQSRAEVRQGVSGEWHYLDAETGERIAIESLTASSGNASSERTNGDADSPDTANTSGRDASFNRVYCITEIDKQTSKDFGFKVGDEVAPEAIAPLLNPFEVEAKPVYVVHTEVGDFTVDQTLTAREYEDARTEYQQLERAFKVEKQDVEQHYVTAVYHAECPLTEGEELNETALTRAHKRFTGFDAQRLRHRITQIHHPNCPLKPGDLISDSEKKQFDERYPGFTTSESKRTAGGFAAERMYRVTAVNHPDCPLETDSLLTQKESSANRRQYKGFDVARHYEVTHIEDGTTALSVGQRLTEIEYKALRKTDASLPDKVKGLYHVVSVHHPELNLEVGTELSEEDYKTYHRQFKGFDVELVYQVTEDKRDVDEQLEVGTILPAKEYRALDKANLQITHTVTEVSHPHFQYAVGDELSEEVYNEAVKRSPGFEVDELSLRMRIEVETSDGNRVPHVIPTGYSFSLTEGDSIRKGETLAELHERTANLDIVAGIPRVTELFEARRPKRGEAAEIAEIEGYVQSAGTKSGIPAYRIEHGTYQSRLYQIPDEKRRVAEGDWVHAGEPLTDGYLNPHDILSIGQTTIEGVSVEGDEAVWSYLVDEVQKVYGKGTINDKHVEAIVRQMLTKIRIKEPGDTNFYPNDEVQRKQFERVNSEIEEAGGMPATGEPILQSISKASLSTDSFISAASFQQTTKVLTDAAVSGQTDRLFGLKENVILGRLIPAGSGFSSFQNLEVSYQDQQEEVSEGEGNVEPKKGSRRARTKSSASDEQQGVYLADGSTSISPTDVGDTVVVLDDE
ncbi:MAG: DNA-directed RNA polymerase subunit beta' [Candidatus Poribacteria bacterium]|nr:DNA-directed RNA polymerase subunit beta' [Candidatus Poribacteria bacterium]